MNWKTDLRLSDLDAATRLEITCRKCGLTHYLAQSDLITREVLQQAYLDEVERYLRCPSRFCRGTVRIALDHGRTEGFVGGMA